jgi:probable HAF family extracellular repeat protein
VAGTSSTSDGAFHAFFSNGAVLEDLGTLGGANSHGMALNNAGTVVGNSQDAQGYNEAFAWDGKTMTSLGTLGGTQSYAYAINNSGEVVGYSWTSDNAMHGFLYSSGVLVDLNSLLPLSSGWTIDAAYSINDAGDILADGVQGGQHYAVDLRPVSSRGAFFSEVVAAVVATPEPGALPLALGGLLTIAVLRRLRRKGAAGQKAHSTDFANR